MTSIRQRLTRKLVVAILLSFGGGLAIVYFAVRTALLTEFDDALRAKAQAVSTVTTWNGAEANVDFSDKFMRGFDDKVATDFFELWQRDGKVIERSESLGPRDLPRDVGSLPEPHFSDLRLPTGAAGRAVGFSFAPQADEDFDSQAAPPELDLVVASDRQALDQTLSVLLAVIVACGLALIAVTVAVIPRVLKTELRPLDRLGEQAAQIDARSLGSRFATNELPSELVPITSRLNDLLGRLQQSFERERRFSADLAHELRTPLAELCGMAEYALQWPESRDPETDKEVLAVGRHMEGLVGRMLSLARSEQGKMSIERQPVELAGLLQNLWKPYVEKVAEKRIQAQLQLTPVTVETDPVLLRAVIGNLLDNAVEYTPPEGEIVISTRMAESIACVTVGNTATGFDPEDLSKLFDRFWRKEASRTGQAHTGLGLALAREFAELLGWSLAAGLNGADRLTFRLTGPARLRAEL